MLLELDEWLPDDDRCAPGLEVLMMCVVAMLGVYSMANDVEKQR